MILAILGDVHGDFESVERAFSLEPGAVAWLCVGDVASDSGDYPSPSRAFFFIKGNNEDFDLLARLAGDEAVVPNLHLIPNAAVVRVHGVRVAGLGGTFAPTWYDTPPDQLPAGRRDLSRRSGGAGSDLSHRSGAAGSDVSRRSSAAAKADKRRHLVRAEVEACLALAGVDIVLTHEAPRPYWIGAGRRRNDAGKAVVNEILAAIRPRLHVFGHHHRLSERVCEGVPSVGLPLARDGYLRVETDAWRWEFRAAG